MSDKPSITPVLFAMQTPERLNVCDAFVVEVDNFLRGKLNRNDTKGDDRLDAVAALNAVDSLAHLLTERATAFSAELAEQARVEKRARLQNAVMLLVNEPEDDLRESLGYGLSPSLIRAFHDKVNNVIDKSRSET